ncbi:MAG: prepilin-type N-terminal cleavage/methylation domain-containing protein [Akkermansia sp.]
MKIRTHISRKVTGRKGFTLIELLVVIAIIASLASVAYGPILNQLNKGDQNMALQNMNMIYSSMQQFEQDNGSYPCDDTAEMVQAKKPEYNFGPLTGQYSNNYFRQLLFSIMDDEKNFYCKLNTESGKKTREPDSKLAQGKALQRGECAFAYVMKEDGAAVNTNNTSLPILMCAVEEQSTGDAVHFDSASFRGKGIVIRLDKSAVWKELEEAGDVYSYPDLFREDKKGRSTGENFVVLPPEL